MMHEFFPYLQRLYLDYNKITNKGITVLTELNGKFKFNLENSF